MSLANEFARIFAGLDRAYGWYKVNATDAVPGKKVKGKAATRKEPVTIELWEQHLAGEQGLGIVPVREDGTVVFGAIDVDVYDLDLEKLHAHILELGLPLVLCRTKSGGAHLYLFTKEPVPAHLLRRKLSDWSVALHHGGSEIFPKQDTIIDEKSYGNWINMPYFGGEDSLRYALAGKALTPTEFITHVDSMSVANADVLKGIVAKLPPVKEETSSDVDKYFFGGPPCLRILAKTGFPDGSRNNALFSVCVYAKKRYNENDWRPKVREINQLFMDPPLEPREVEDTIKGMSAKKYGYKCKDSPICTVCDKKVCVTTEYGIGGGVTLDDLDLIFGRMTRLETDPISWLWEINNQVVEFSSEALTNQRLFQIKMMERMSILPPAIKAGQWLGLVQRMILEAEVMEVPDDATAAGELWEYLAKFCTSRVAGRSLDELLIGKPYTDLNDDRSYFVCADFVAYLTQHRFTKANVRDIYLMLRERGLQDHVKIIKEKSIRYWSVPAFKAQTQEHTVPRQAPKDVM